MRAIKFVYRNTIRSGDFRISNIARVISLARSINWKVVKHVSLSPGR